MLKRIQSLPQRTANEAPYILFGILPAEALLDIKTLIFFHNIITDHNSILYQVAMGQLATKSLASNSWFTTINKLALKYDIPSLHKILNNPPGALEWKRLVKKSVHAHWQKTLSLATKQNSTLALLPDLVEPPSLENVALNTHAVSRARLQTWVFTNTFTLQSHRSTFYKEDIRCKICGTEPETTVHLLARCPALSQTWSILLKPVLFNIQASTSPSILPTSDEDIARLLLGVNPLNTKNCLYDLYSLLQTGTHPQNCIHMYYT